MSEDNKYLMITNIEVKGKDHKINLGKYSNFFSDKALFDKFKKFAKNAGIKVVYAIIH